MVVERAVVNGMPTAMEIIREVDERVTAIQQGGLVLEFLHPDACRREARERLLPSLWSGSHSLGVSGGRKVKRREVGVRCPASDLVQFEESQISKLKSPLLSYGFSRAFQMQ